MKFPKTVVNHYIKNIKKEISISGVLLFGSFANNNATKDSDVDLVIISEKFKNISFDDRLDWLTSKRDKKTYKIAMDVIGYTPEEFKTIHKKSAIMAKAKKTGKWLYKF